MKRLPGNFMDLPADEQRKIVIASVAENYRNHDIDAWYSLLMNAVEHDPHIPRDVKDSLKRRIIMTLHGQGTIDPISTERRQKEDADEEMYVQVVHAFDETGTLREAINQVAKAHDIGFNTVRRTYKRHTTRNPDCPRLDGRSRK